MGVTVAGPVAIAPGTSFLAPAICGLGRYVTIGEGSRIVSWGSVEIGDDSMAERPAQRQQRIARPRHPPAQIGHGAHRKSRVVRARASPSARTLKLATTW